MYFKTMQTLEYGIIIALKQKLLLTHYMYMLLYNAYLATQCLSAGQNHQYLIRKFFLSDKCQAKLLRPSYKISFGAAKNPHLPDFV